MTGPSSAAASTGPRSFFDPVGRASSAICCMLTPLPKQASASKATKRLALNLPKKLSTWANDKKPGGTLAHALSRIVRVGRGLAPRPGQHRVRNLATLALSATRLGVQFAVLDHHFAAQHRRR